ncbi:hypothetical protein [Plantactinospora sp. DSM 117369]
MGKVDKGSVDISVEEVIALADRDWRAMGVIEADRAGLVDDLRSELTGAAAEGLTPRQLLGGDIRGFVRDLAAGAGVRRVSYEFRRLFLTAFAGALPGLVLAWILLWERPLPLEPNLWLLTSQYLAFALLVLVGALVAVRWGMRGTAVIGRTVSRMALLVPLAGALATPVVMGLAALVDYSTALPAVAIEAAIVAAALGEAIVLARRWALAPALGPARAKASGVA